MLIYVMLIIFLLMTIYTYIKARGDILQPSVIFSAMYTFSILCATLNKEYWGIDLSWKTFFIIVLGGLEFIIISFLVDYFYKKKYDNDMKINQNEDNKGKIIKIEKWKIAIIFIYSIVVIILLVLNVLSIASEFGEFSNFSEALTIFRQNTSYESNASLSQIMSLLLKPLFAAAYICLFVYIKNIIYKEGKLTKKIFTESIYLLPVLAFVIQSLVQSNRGSILRIAIAGFSMFVIIWYQKWNWKRKVSIKAILSLVIIACIGLTAFYFSATLVGRKISKNLIQYVTMYCGGSIQCLDMYVKEPAKKSDIFGYETFTYFIRNLQDYLGLELDEVPTTHLEWRKSNGVLIGNVYTSYRRWIQDFGYVGMILLQAGVALFYNIFYNKMKYSKNKSSTINDIGLLTYAYLAYPLFIHSIDSIFYLNVFRLYFITQTITLIIGYIFLLKTEISLKNGLNIKIYNREIVKKWKIQSIKKQNVQEESDKIE